MKKILIVEKGTKQFNLAENALPRLDELLKDNDGRLTLDYPTFANKFDKIILTESIDDCEKFGLDVSEIGEFHLRLSGNNPHRAQAIAYGLIRGENFLDICKTDSKDEHTSVYAEDGERLDSTFTALGVQLAKELVNTPGNKLYPEAYADLIMNEFDFFAPSVKVTKLDDEDLHELGFDSLLSVAQGSDQPACVVVMEYIGNPDLPIETALVGKGVTFDSGGISLKPGSKMHEMKTDMAGSAAVVGAILDLAAKGSKANVVGIVGLVENMPSGSAVKPGDVTSSYSGKTIENWNTDAEGRLVLCDLLSYVQDKYELKTIIDVATLTGAIVVALGDEYAGLFTNSTDLAEDITMLGSVRYEQFWRMPMGKVFRKQLDSKIADIKNIGNGHPGSTTAAEFLYEFVEPNIAWAHLDIAGVAYKNDMATGFAVETLAEFVDVRSEIEYIIDENMEY